MRPVFIETWATTSAVITNLATKNTRNRQNRSPSFTESGKKQKFLFKPDNKNESFSNHFWKKKKIDGLMTVSLWYKMFKLPVWSEKFKPATSGFKVSLVSILPAELTVLTCYNHAFMKLSKNFSFFENLPFLNVSFK